MKTFWEGIQTAAGLLFALFIIGCATILPSVWDDLFNGDTKPKIYKPQKWLVNVEAESSTDTQYFYTTAIVKHDTLQSLILPDKKTLTMADLLDTSAFDPERDETITKANNGYEYDITLVKQK